EGGNAVVSKSVGLDAAFESLGLNEEAGEIAAQIDGRKSAAEIASATGKEVFNVYKLLEALRILGVINKGAAPPEEDFRFESAGVADAADVWSAPPEEVPVAALPPPPPPAGTTEASEPAPPAV